MELNCALKLRWKKGQAVGGNYVSVGGHQGGKTAKNGLGASNPAVNSGTESADHGHSWTAYIQAGVGDGGVFHMPTVGDKGNGLSYTTTIGTGGRSAAHTHGTTTAVSLTAGDNETRPTNRGVRYIIKV